MFKAVLALFGAASILFLGAGATEAAPTGLNVTQTCSGNSANMTFNWRGVAANSRQVWIDLTTNENWRANTFISAGPLAATDTSYLWTGIKANTVHYFRITEQLANGTWVASITSSFEAVCGSTAASGATPEEQSYRNRASAQLTAVFVRLVQAPRSRGPAAGSAGLLAVFKDLVTTLNNLEPVPPRFRDAHYQLRDILVEVVACMPNPNCSADEEEELFEELDDALTDYELIVGL